MSTSLETTVQGEPVVLLPERALLVPNERALVVADLHWGKAATFRAAHVPIPTGTTASDLARLTRVLHRTGAAHLIVLGDLLHARSGRHPDLIDALEQWRAQHPSLAITLVRGNHDTHAGDPPSSLAIDCVDGPWPLGTFLCDHEPWSHPDAYTLSGHLHPSVTLGGRGRERLRLPCFVFGPTYAILPAFTSFTGGGAYSRDPADRLYAVTEEEVLPVP